MWEPVQKTREGGATFAPEQGAGLGAEVPKAELLASGCTITNFSDLQPWQFRPLLPRESGSGDQIILLPDACPGKARLPTGSVLSTSQQNWRELAVSDIGCGMQLLRSGLGQSEFKRGLWDNVGVRLKSNRGSLGDLGGGNHFLDAIVSKSDRRLYFLIHTGSRTEGRELASCSNDAKQWDREYKHKISWSRQNRDAVAQAVAREFGDCELVLDSCHNFVEPCDSGVVIRKGAVKVAPGESAVLPSSLNGEVVLLRATDQVAHSLFSISHGTGRTMRRAEARDAVTEDQIAAVRRSVYIPDFIDDRSLRTEGPACYRELDACLDRMQQLAQVTERFEVIAYLGHL